MSTIKSSAENLTLNADGANNDIKFQSNGSEVASIDQAGSLVLSGNLTSVGIDDNADATAITINSSEQVGIGTASIDERLHVQGGDHERIQIESTVAGDAVIIHKNTVNTWKVGATASVGGYGGDGKYSIADGNDIRLAIHPTTGYVSAVQGLVFGTDTAAANALDDYEEGTYAAVVSGSTSGTFTMATENTLAYTKIGRLVTVQGYVGIQSGSVGGNCRLSLPFAPTALTEDADYNFPSLMIQNQGNTIAGQKYLFLQTDGSAYFYRVQDSGAANYISNGDVDGNFEIGVSFTYISG